MIQSVVAFQSRKVSFGTLFDSQSVKFDPSLFGKQTILLTEFDVGMLFLVYSKIHQSIKQKCSEEYLENFCRNELLTGSK